MRAKKTTLLISTFILLLLSCFHTYAKEQLDYHETIAVLEALYNNETVAYQFYSAFARKACEDKYFNVANLFIALQSSETIHARNFKRNLSGLGKNHLKEVSEIEIKVSGTKENLKYALSVELAEIDSGYPKFIHRIKPEGYKAAMNDITYAWKAEKQHRDLIEQMHSALPFFFRKIDKKLKKKANKYFVCQRCGSTLTKLPDHTCPICGSPSSRYKEIQNFEKFVTNTKIN
jgi:rubrerythrin